MPKPAMSEAVSEEEKIAEDLCLGPEQKTGAWTMRYISSIEWAFGKPVPDLRALSGLRTARLIILLCFF